MVRRNPKSVASFSNSLISVVAGISGTPSIPRAVLAPQIHVFDSSIPTLNEREAFFTDIDVMAHREEVASRSSTAEEASKAVEEVLLPEIESVDTIDVEAIGTAGEAPVVEDAIAIAISEDLEENSSNIVLGNDLNISLSDYLDTVKPVDETTPTLPENEEVSAEEALAVSEVAIVEEVELPEVEALVEALVEEINVSETSVETTAIVEENKETENAEASLAVAVEATLESEEPETEVVAEEPVLETETLEEPAPAIEPVSVTESVVRAVLQQFEDKSDSVPDADMIRSIAEQVASQMAAQQTAMRIAQQVLSTQTPVPMPMPISMPTGQAVPVPGVATAGEGVTIQPVAFPVSGVSGEPVAIPGFNPAAYLAPSAPVQYQQGPGVVMPSAPIQYQQGPGVVMPGAPIQYQQGPGVVMPGAPIQYQQGPGVVMPGAPVQYQQGPGVVMPGAPVQFQYQQEQTPVWTPPSDDTPVPTQDQLASFAPTQYILNIQAPAATPESPALKSAPSTPVERIFPTFEPPKNDVAFDEPTKLPSIDAFDPSAYLGMNAVPSLPSMVQEVIEEEPAWEPVYEFAPVADEETAAQETEEDIRAREARRAQQMLRELSGLRDLRS